LVASMEAHERAAVCKKDFERVQANARLERREKLATKIVESKTIKPR
jgi:hypothetical protein